MSWKKYGGITQLSKANNLNVNSVITDTLTLRNNYDGNFRINGSLIVSPDDSSTTSEINNNLDVSGNLIVRGEVTFEGNIQPSEVEIDQLLRVTETGEAILEGKVLFDASNASTNTFLFGTKENIGINTLDPSYVLDLCGNQEKLVRFVSNSEQVESIMIQNKNSYGIAFTTDNSSNRIKFYHNDVSYNSETSAASISYDPSGQMIHDVSRNIQLKTRKLLVGYNDHGTNDHGTNDHGTNDHGTNDHGTNDESTVVFYDQSATPDVFLSHVDISESTTSSVALKLVSTDASSSTFMKAVNRDNIGWNYGGGTYPLDSDRGMGSIGWTDICSTNYVFDDSRYIPSQTIVSGNSLVQTRATTGFNTFKPATEDCVMDINGPVKIGHNEIHETAVMPFRLNSISKSKTSGISIVAGNQYQIDVCGNSDYYFLISDNDGKRWRSESKKVEDITNLEFKAYVCDSSFGVVYTSNETAYYYTRNSFEPLNETGKEATTDNCRYVFKYPDENKYRMFTFSFNTTQGDYFHWDFQLNANGGIIGNGTRQDNDDESQKYVKDISYNVIHSIDGTNELNNGEYTFYLAGGRDSSGIIIEWRHSSQNGQTGVSNNFHINPNIPAYTSIKKVGNHMIAVGSNYITTFDTLVGNSSGIDTSFSDVSFNDVFIYDNSCAMVVGDQASIYYSTDYRQQGNWARLTEDDVDTMGNARSLFHVSNNIKTIHIDSSYQFMFGCEKDMNGGSESKVFYCYFPKLFYPDSAPDLFDVDGNANVSGNMNVDGNANVSGNMNVDGNITGLTTMNLFPTSDTVNIGSLVGNGTVQTNILDVNKLLLKSNPALDYYEDVLGRPESYKNGDITYTLSKTIVIGDANTRIDISGYLNLLDVSATNIKGGSSSASGGGLDEDAVNALINDKVSVKYDSDKSVSRTSSKYLFVNYDGAYNVDLQTAGSGFYIYNDISSGEGISVDQQLKDGYIRISKYKVDGKSKQDSFSFRATGQDKSVRLNIQKLNDSITDSDTTRRPLIFTEKLSRIGNPDITDEDYGEMDNYEDDHIQIATDEKFPYVDGSGHLHTNELDFFTRDISMSGHLFATDASFHGDVFVDEDLSVNGGLFATDASFHGHVFVEKDLSVNGSLFATDASFHGEVFVEKDLSVNGGLFATDASFHGEVFVEKDLSVNGSLFATDASFHGHVFVEKDLSVNGDLFAVSASFQNSSVSNILTLSGTGTDTVMDVSGISYTAAQVAEALEGGFNGGELEATSLTLTTFDENGDVDDNIVAITVNGINYTAGAVKIGLSGGGGSGSGSNAPIISGRSDFYATNGYFGGDVYVSGKVHLGSSVPSLDESSVVQVDMLKLGVSGEDIVLDVSGIQFTGSQIAEVLNGGGGGGGGGGGSTIVSGVNINSNSDFYGKNAYYDGDIFVAGKVNFGLGVSIQTNTESTNIIALDGMEVGDASFNGNVYMDQKLTLSPSGENIVLDVSGIEYTGSQIANALNGTFHVDDNTNNNIIEILKLERTCDDISPSKTAEGGYIGLYVTDDDLGGELARISWRADNADNYEGDGRLSFWTAKADGTQTVRNDFSLNEQMTITRDGNVGIGTTSPTATLDVSGTFQVRDRIFMDDVYANTVVGFDASGNKSKLGEGYPGRDYGWGNSFFGYNAGRDVSNSSTKNTGVGAYSLESLTTGSHNNGLGSHALNSVTTGGNNVAIGHIALWNITDGLNNTAVGHRAAYNANDISYCSFFGSNTQVDISNTYYEKSTAVGYGATIDASNQIMLGTANETVSIPGFLVCKGNIYYNATDFIMAYRGIVPSVWTVKENCGRIFVADGTSNNPILTINYDNDFSGGTIINGDVEITGDAKADSFNATSDYRLKENIQTISGDNYTVDNIRPVSYTFKDSQQPHIGFIAHELQEHVPTAVMGEKDGEKMQSVNYSELIPILVKEIQDLKQDVRHLKESLYQCRSQSRNEKY